MTCVHRFFHPLPDASAVLDRCCNIWLTAHSASSSRDPWGAGDLSVDPQAATPMGTATCLQPKHQEPALSQQEGAHSLHFLKNIWDLSRAGVSRA